MGGSGGATGGSGGATGGSGGGGAAGAAVPSCRSDSDCTLHNDCCTCTALGPDDPKPPACNDQQCFTDACSAIGLEFNHQPKCIDGACAVGFDCDPSHALCDAIPPHCPEGQVVTVKGACWGGCVPPNQCAYVRSCDECGDRDFCVENLGEKPGAYHCIHDKAGCGITCSCLRGQVCVGKYTECDDGLSTKDRKIVCKEP